MAKLFSQNAANEDKTVLREERISFKKTYIDATNDLSGGEYGDKYGGFPGINTTSFSQKQMLCCNIDAITMHYPDGDITHVVAQYAELDDKNYIRILTDRGYIDIGYHCTRANMNMVTPFSCYMFIGSKYNVGARIYISNVRFMDSYTDNNTGWLNNADPENLISVLHTEELPGVRRMNLAYLQKTFVLSYLPTPPTFPRYDDFYSDDFLKLGVVQPNQSLARLMIMPINNFKAKAGNEISINRSRDSGVCNFQIPAGPAALPFRIDPVDISYITPSSPNPPANNTIAVPGMPTDSNYAFFLPLTFANQHFFTAVWDADDGYTYELRGNYLPIAGGGTGSPPMQLDLNLSYYGRNATGTNPVPDTE